MTEAIKKGYIIDEYCDYKSGELVVDGDMVYSCTLNQTEIDANKNKFYIMQIVNSGSNYYHFIRYGRIGEPGKSSHKSFPTLDAAKSSFEKQFKTKTGNAWGAKNFIKKDGKYFLSQISYEDEMKDIPNDIKPIKIPDSQLQTEIQNLIKMLTDVNMMKNTLIQLDIDTKKMPLGKLKGEQIDSANEILDRISKGIDDGQTQTELTKLSSEYYTFIPNACGRRKPPLINTKEIVAKYKGILDDLSNIVITKKIIEQGENANEKNPIDAIYEDLNTKINPVANTHAIYPQLEQYIANTHGPTHGSRLQLLQVFEVEQNGKSDKFHAHSDNIGNKMLLFHGTPQSCVLSIFKKDFYLDPSKLGVQIAGKMFGYGVYFADIATKSFNYTRAQATNDIGCMIMCEVALGKTYERFDADCGLNKEKVNRQSCDSTHARGKWEPKGHTDFNGVKIPNEPIKENKFRTSLRYNEYIVYDINQINIKYLLLVKNNGNYSGF